MAKAPSRPRRSRSRSRAAAEEAAQPETHACSLPPVPVRELPTELHPARLRLIRVNEKKWANGTRLHYYFFDRPTDGPNGAWVGPEAQKNVVRQAFQAWKDLEIGLEFEEVVDREDAEVRIAFDQDDGSWSYVGRDVIDIANDPNEATMNFGWDLTTDYGWDTAMHEIGHTLGFPHEHQNPNAGIVWNESAVYDYFGGYPNYWSRATTEWNVLRKLPVGSITGSEWDPNSIMHYGFPAGLIASPAEYSGGLSPQPGLSERDISFVRQFYPPLAPQTEPELRAFESQRLLIGAGEQVNFRIRPRQTRRYTIQTFGTSDTVMVLFEDAHGGISYIDGDDDSGWSRNARIETRLYRDHDYILRLRLYYSQLSGETAVMLW